MLDYMIENGIARVSSVPSIMIRKSLSKKTGGIVDEDADVVNDLENEEVLQFDTKKSKEYRIEKSTSSFQFDDILGFTYGPMSSRFWMLRKLTLNMNKN